ncbi:hypothetical protein [Cellulomonas iranensis]|uniref:hypothetical protein n=1 Tax=Cellulomonas iranensis TaxID=76862 RepID=UPI0015C5C9D0|nr:hypothetical protein [Cellulomonas iranensis]
MMSALSTTTPSGELSERVVSTLRTAVPALWGSAVAWLLARLVGVLPPDVADPLAAALGSDVVVALVVAVAIAAWYAVWRFAEPHVPTWLVRVVLGSARTPAYAPVTSDGVAVVTSVPAADLEDAVLSALDDAHQAGDLDPVSSTGPDLIAASAHVTRELAARGIVRPV